jgi:hypothetical protein
MVLVILASMDIPVSLDPLIAEAKQRMRRRRTTLAAIVLLAGATAATLALRPWGSAPVGGHVSPRAGAKPALARLHVPMDSDERHWRSLVRGLAGPAASRSAVLTRRSEVVRLLNATGAALVRLKIWPRTSPPAVELVATTSLNPAVFLRHHAMDILTALAARPDFVKVVDARGSEVFEWGGASNEGFVGVPPALYYCQPVGTGMPPPYRPCPAK